MAAGEIPVMTSGAGTCSFMSCKAAQDTAHAGEPARATFLAWVSRLVHDHRASLARVARSEGLSPEDAFDAVQEAFHTFLTLPQARNLVDEPDQSRKLLSVLTRNVARNRRRLHAVARPHDSDAGGRRGASPPDPPASRRPSRPPNSTCGWPAAWERWPRSSGRWSRCACWTRCRGRTWPACWESARATSRSCSTGPRPACFSA